MVRLSTDVERNEVQAHCEYANAYGTIPMLSLVVVVLL